VLENAKDDPDDDNDHDVVDDAMGRPRRQKRRMAARTFDMLHLLDFRNRAMIGRIIYLPLDHETWTFFSFPSSCIRSESFAVSGTSFSPHLYHAYDGRAFVQPRMVKGKRAYSLP
jgi:hypothetical protein